MNDRETTIQIAPTETHDRVAVILGTHAIAYRPYDALVISATILDAVVGCDPDEQTPIQIAGHPRVGVTAGDARTIARAIATCADQLLVEADLAF